MMRARVNVSARRDHAGAFHGWIPQACVFFLLSWLLARCVAGENAAVPDALSVLESSDVFVLSSAGSHSFLRTDGGAGIGTLGYRQLSDWSPGLPLFDPVGGFAVHSGSRAISLRRTGYRWCGDHVERKQTTTSGVFVEEWIGYVGEDLVLAELDVRNRGRKSANLVITGRPMAPHEFHTEKEFGFLGVSFDLDLGSMWGRRSRFRETFVIGTNLRRPFTAASSGVYEVSAEIPAGEKRSIRFGLAPESLAGQLEAALHERGSARTAVRNDLGEWMTELPGMGDVSAKRRRACCVNWFWLWFNLEHAQGLWIRDIISPSKVNYGRGVWLWDSAFHVQALLHGGNEARRRARDQIEVLTSTLPHGHLPREIWVQTASTDLQPPGILSLAALEVYEKERDRGFLERVYPALAENNRWFYRHRCPDDVDLCWWERGDSGWDNSPRWDDGPCLAVDLNAWLYLDHLCLIRISDLLGLDDSSGWREKAEHTRRLIDDYLWNENDGCYYDVRLSDREQRRLKTPAMFLPLFARAASSDQARRVARFGDDPNVFAAPYPVPSVAISSPSFTPDTYLRGPVCISLNWIAIVGLRNYGFDDQADRLAEKTMALVEMNPVPYEYYNPLTGVGFGAECFAWSAALYVDLALGGSTVRP
jgi:hypothetical protein